MLHRPKGNCSRQGLDWMTKLEELPALLSLKTLKIMYSFGTAGPGTVGSSFGVEARVNMTEKTRIGS